MPSEPGPTIESEPSSFLEKQWREQLKLWHDTGLLFALPEASEKKREAVGGVIGMDGKEYPFPKLTDVRAEIQANPEKYKTKIEQGFNQLLIVPFACSLEMLQKAMAFQIKKHHKQGKLLSTTGEPLELDENEPFWVWDEFERADEDGSLVYYPKRFNQEEHEGKTKQEILDQTRNSTFSGYNVLSLENLPDLPRQGKGQEVKGRKQIEANKTPNEYLELLKQMHEQGLTPEDWIAYFLKHLKQTNQVIDDYQGRGSACWLTAAYHPASDDVPNANWYRNFRQANLSRGNPGSRNVNDGLRPAVSLSTVALAEVELSNIDL